MINEVPEQPRSMMVPRTCRIDLERTGRSGRTGQDALEGCRPHAAAEPEKAIRR